MLGQQVEAAINHAALENQYHRAESTQPWSPDPIVQAILGTAPSAGPPVAPAAEYRTTGVVEAQW
ncbi:hypothetical protein [Kribbella jiaozuonensis]|uniref:Uncharacterized protein n=1 Tax=Kribbella jiaozuonensis TaxID=2575441 RepID=A0A4U3M5Z2_9ACTN|nr:hypothetical protein [Kribbella jiaozuonensis]TKK82817.1 hypothetical protein FDA38_08675 [Kribbella jiaozuonensis]